MPATQAGHQTHHTTTHVYMPHTVHPKAASRSTSPIPTPAHTAPAKITTGGENATSRAADAGFKYGEHVALVLGRTKESGEESRPTAKERLKFRVARVERNIPRSNNDKEWMSVYCWSVGGGMRI